VTTPGSYVLVATVGAARSEPVTVTVEGAP